MNNQFNITEYPDRGEMKEKRCSGCKEIKSINDFYKSKNNKDGYRGKCKSCFNKIQKEWYKNNLVEIKKRHKRYRKNNQEKINRYQKIYCKKYRKNNPTLSRKWDRKSYLKKRKNIKFRLNRSIRRLIFYSLKKNKNGIRWRELIDFSLSDLIIHLELQFKNGMSWKNYGDWHIDHIVPMDYFEFNSPDDDEFQICWSLNNLQPLWAGENLSKGNKFVFKNKEEFKKVSNIFLDYIKKLSKRHKCLRVGYYKRIENKQLVLI